MKTLNKRRDELALAYELEQIKMPIERLDKVTYAEDFSSGYSAGFAEAQAQAKVLVESLDKIHKRVSSTPFSNGDKWGDLLETVYQISGKTLEQYRKAVSGE